MCPAGDTAVNPNAFKQAEKKYQRHVVQQGKRGYVNDSVVSVYPV